MCKRSIKRKLNLSTFPGVIKFSEYIREHNSPNCEMQIISSTNKIVDAKSILGILSLNLLNPVTLIISGLIDSKEIDDFDKFCYTNNFIKKEDDV